MKQLAVFVVTAICGLCLIAVLIIGMSFATQEHRRYFGTRGASIEREVFEGSRSYTRGMQQQLARYRLQYQRTESSEDRAAIASTVRIQFAEYDPATLPDDLRSFYFEVTNR